MKVRMQKESYWRENGFVSIEDYLLFYREAQGLATKDINI